MNDMKKILWMLMAVFMTVLAGCSSDNDGPKEDSQDETPGTPNVPMSLTAEQVAVNSNEVNMAFEIFEDIYNNTSKRDNILFSPLSKDICMGMIANAVTPEDRRDMLDKYGFSSVEALNEYSRDRMQYLSYNHSKAKVAFANSAWANSLTMTSASDYASVSNVLDKYYGAESRILDFGKSDVLSLINCWCSDKTNGLIHEFLKEKPSNQTQSMIINTLYFDCAWKQPFPKSKSDRLYDFYDEYGQRRCRVHMMSNNVDIDYVQSDACSAIRIPYADCNYSAIFAMPRNGNGVKNTTKEILPSLKQMIVSKAFDSGEKASMEVYLPKMTIESSERIDQYICNNGIDLKNKKLLGFDQSNPIGIQQATFLSLYEEGTRVAAATSSDYASAPGSLIFDQPFVMIIQDNNTGSIVLMAVVRMPKE